MRHSHSSRSSLVGSDGDDGRVAGSSVDDGLPCSTLTTSTLDRTRSQRPANVAETPDRLAVYRLQGDTAVWDYGRVRP